MTITEWKTDWLKSVVEAGFSPSTALDTYKAMYGLDGPDLSKCPMVEAANMLGTPEKL